MTREAFAHEAEILRKMRRQQHANTLAIVVLVLGFLAVAAYYVLRSDVRQRPPPPAIESPEITDDSPPPSLAPTATTQAPLLTAPAPVTKPAFVDPRPRITPESIPGPAPTVSDRRAALPQDPARPARSEPSAVGAPAATGQEALDFKSSAAAKRVLVSIKCFDDFVLEREEGGRQYFSAVCESGSRREVSCAGAGCRIEYDPAPSHYPD